MRRGAADSDNAVFTEARGQARAIEQTLIENICHIALKGLVLIGGNKANVRHCVSGADGLGQKCLVLPLCEGNPLLRQPNADDIAADRLAALAAGGSGILSIAFIAWRYLRRFFAAVLAFGRNNLRDSFATVNLSFRKCREWE